jgi:hypothetical protein
MEKGANSPILEDPFIKREQNTLVPGDMLTSFPAGFLKKTTSSGLSKVAPPGVPPHPSLS